MMHAIKRRVACLWRDALRLMKHAIKRGEGRTQTHAIASDTQSHSGAFRAAHRCV